VVTEGNPFQQTRPLSAERAQLFQRTGETLAERFEEELGRWLGESTVRVEPVDITPLPALAGPDTDLAIVKAHYHLTHGVIASELPLALTLVSMLCGGTPTPAAEIRPLSRLEMGVFDLLLAPLAAAAAEVFEVGPVELGHHVTNASALPDSKPEPAVGIPLQLGVGGVEGRVTVGLTLGQIQAYSEEVDRRIAGRMAARTNTVNLRAVRAVKPVPVELVVGFDPMLVPAGQLAGLQVGDVLRTRQSVTKHLVARVGSERIFQVRAAQRGQRLVAELIARIDSEKGLA
jgi:flagellar motor switch protein FliM